MKKYMIAIILLILLGVLAPSAGAEETSNQPAFGLPQAMDSIDTGALDEYKYMVDSELNSSLDKKSARAWLTDFIKGDWQFDFKETGHNLVSFFFKEITANSGLLGKLIILSVLAALLVNLQTSFSSGVARISYMACFLALCAIALGSFRLVLSIGQDTIENMVAFMLGMLPQMLVLVAGLGNINTSAMLFPILMTTATAFANAIKNIVFPLIILSAILHLVNHMSETVKVERLAKFFSQMAQVCLGLFLTIFVGIVTLRALYGSVLDKVALRTTRFIADNTIPVVGKMVSDTIEVAAGYVVMLKQALGIFGVLAVFAIIIFPLLKIAAIALIYRLTAAIVEPMGDTKTAAVLEIMSTHLLLMLASIAAVGLMFFIMITIVAGMSNYMSMLR